MGEALQEQSFALEPLPQTEQKVYDSEKGDD